MARHENASSQVVNAFSTQNDVEMRGKTISRLESITTLQKTLEDCLQGKQLAFILQCEAS